MTDSLPKPKLTLFETLVLFSEVKIHLYVPYLARLGFD